MGGGILSRISSLGGKLYKVLSGSSWGHAPQENFRSSEVDFDAV